MVSFPSDPVLRISNVRAKLLNRYEHASLDIDVDRNGYKMNFQPAKVEIDNQPFFDSIGLKSITALAKDCIRTGRAAALTSASRYTQEAQQKLDGATVVDITYQQVTRSINRMAVCVETQDPEFSVRKAKLDIEYTPDEYQFNWRLGVVNSQYIPYSIDIDVEFLNKGKLFSGSERLVGNE